MQLLDDNLYNHFTAGRISAEEAIDKSRNPGFMVDKMQKAGLNVKSKEDLLLEAVSENPASASAAAAPAAPGQSQDDAAKKAAIEANRQRMLRMQEKK